MNLTRPYTTPAVLASVARTFGAQTAIEDGSIRWTFKELQDYAEHTAGALVGAGVLPGDRIGIWAPNSAHWIVIALAVHCAGACIVPINTRLKGKEAGYILRCSGVKMLFHDGNFLNLRYDELIASEKLPELQKIIALNSHEWSAFKSLCTADTLRIAQTRSLNVTGEDIADVMFTSGTTGQPKGVISNHAQNIRVFTQWSDTVGLQHDDRYLIVNPFFHTFGYKAGWLACLLTGATIIPMRVFDVPKIIRLIIDERISVLPGPPTLFQSILASPKLKFNKLSNLRLAVTGAANVPVKMIEEMRKEMGFKTIITGYGLTESTGVVSLCRPSDTPERISISCGTPLPGVEVKVVNSAGHEVSRGSEGEIWVRGYNVMQGYFNDLEATNAAIDAEGWLHTGDIGSMDEKNYLRITDRMKDMFIVGGFNCYPAEIENLLSAHPLITQVAIVGIPDERLGEVAAAYVVLKYDSNINERELIAWSRKNMANYKVPRKIKFVSSLPMTASGKVQRFALREENLQ